VQITMEPTDEFTVIDGTKCRQWVGMTDHAIPVKVFVQLVVCNSAEDQTDFAHYLREIEPPPEARERPIDLRMIL
jgi:hypothetical protein